MLAAATMVVSCASDDADPTGPQVNFENGNDEIEVNDGLYGLPGTQYSQIPEISMLGIQPTSEGEIILDFSRVGYQWGDKEIPTVPVVETVTAPANGEDATALIQAAIDKVAAKPLSERGAVLLKAGLYNVVGTINLSASGVVLRGEGTDPATGTHIKATRTDDGYAGQTALIKLGTGVNRSWTQPTTMNIIEDVPAGRFWVRVSNPDKFTVGDNVIVHVETPMKLIQDLKMDQIPPRAGYDASSYQWNENTINNKNMERVITKIKADTLWFENPISMGIWSKYNGGSVSSYSYSSRTSESGVENMYLSSVYASEDDENHCWSAIDINTAVHCWVRNVHAQYFGMSLAYIKKGSKNITVTDCKMTQNKSQITGDRRYPFLIVGQLCLVKDCLAEDGRHSYATSSSNANGPNVFLRCNAKLTHADIGPHHRWATGTLYDIVTGTGTINVQDRADMGPGHGWTETNAVLWNCEGSTIAVQSPWVLGKNYSIGTVGTKGKGYKADRPDGVWVSHGAHVSPASLYEAQLAARRTYQPGGVFDVQ